MRVVYWTAILGLAIILGVFAVSNREAVSLALWPLPFVVGLPLYLMVFATVLAGFLVGALTTCPVRGPSSLYTSKHAVGQAGWG